MALNVVLNGEDRAFAELGSKVSLAALVQELALKGDRIAVELNGEIAERSRWSSIEVQSGDRLEVVHFVGGGSGEGIRQDRGARVAGFRSRF